MSQQFLSELCPGTYPIKLPIHVLVENQIVIHLIISVMMLLHIITYMSIYQTYGSALNRQQNEPDTVKRTRCACISLSLSRG